MKKLVTIILDGFGMREEEFGNAPKLAHMNFFESLWKEYPHSLLKASEEAVGLSANQAGNSEVGHMTIGAGRLLKQNEILVNEFLDNPKGKNIQKLLEEKDKTVHMMGLCSDGNIHAGIDDFINMYKLLVQNGFKKICFHLITDGRDTGVHDSLKYISMIQNLIDEYKVGSIESICGRYYAMDRDKNYDRTKKYYDLVTKGVGLKTKNIRDAIEKFYEKDITDEFIEPVYCGSDTVQDGDVLLWMNYREDRAKQILSSFVNWRSFEHFECLNMSNLKVYSFLPVDPEILTINLIDHNLVDNPLGIYLSSKGIRQARIAESEKYPHVTYFFDGGYSGEIKNCEKLHIPSPKVKTYDEKPEMSAHEVTENVITKINENVDFILVNYANPDMVGHTGNLDPTIKACKTIDECLERVVKTALNNDFGIMILADHGNSDTMINEDGTSCTTHTTSLVPFILCDREYEVQDGDLTNIAPTILDYMGFDFPTSMKKSKSLIVK